MPPRRYSRHTYTEGFTDPNGDFLLTIPEPYRFREFPDTRIVTANEGESLFSIAGREFEGLARRPAGLWWIIADFQPEPIHDPTLLLDPGRTLYIPSDRTIREEIFGPSRKV